MIQGHGHGRGSFSFEWAATGCNTKRGRNAIDRDLDDNSLPDSGQSTSQGIA